MALAIDGTASNSNNTNAPSITLSLTTTQANDYIIVVATQDGGSNVASVSGSTLGSFSTFIDPVSETVIFAKFASSALTSETITVTRTGGPGSFMAAEAFAVSGSNQTSLVWDGGGQPTSSGSSISFTNSTADCMVFGVFVHAGNPSPFPQGSFTTVSGNTTGANTILCEKLLKSTTGATTVAGDSGAYSGSAFGVPLAAGGPTAHQISATFAGAGGLTAQATGLFNVSSTLAGAGGIVANAVSDSWKFVGISATVETTATGHTLTEPAGVQPGDLLVAVISSRIASTTSITLPSGWTRVTEQKTNNVLTTTSAVASGMMAYIIRGSSAPSYAFTHPTAPSVAIGQVVAYRPPDSVTPLNTQNSATTAINTTAVSVAGVTTTVNRCLLVVGACGGQEAAWSAFDAATDPPNASGTGGQTGDPSGTTWLERSDTATTTGADTSLAIADAVKQVAGATGNITATASLGASHAILIGAFDIQSTTAWAGSATFAGAGSFTADLKQWHAITAQFAGAGSFTPGGNLKQWHVISAQFAGVGGLTADVTFPTAQQIQISATFAGIGGLAGNVIVTKPITATFAGIGGLTASLSLTSPLSATFAGVGNLAASLSQRMTISATFAGIGGLVADVTPPGAQAYQISATFAGVGGLVGNVLVTKPITATFAGVGSLTASLSGSSPITATFGGTGSLAAQLAQWMALRSTFAGVGGLVADVTPPGVQTYPITATLAGVGGLTANVLVTKPISATFAGAGNLAASLSQRMAVSVTFAGIGGLSADGLVTKPISAAFAGIGGLSASLSMSMPIAGTFAGVGSLAATLVPPVAQTYSIEATFAGTGSLTVAMAQRLPIVAAFAGVGSLADVTASMRMPIAAGFAGVGGLTANPFIVTSGQQLINALFSGVGGLFADLELIEAPRPPFLGGIGEPPYRQLRPVYADIECKIETGQGQFARGRLQQDIVFMVDSEQDPIDTLAATDLNLAMVVALRQLRGETKGAARVVMVSRSETRQHAGGMDMACGLRADLVIKSGGEAPPVPEYHGEPEFFTPMSDKPWD